MLHKIGYEVVYHDGAFRTATYPSVTPHRWTPLPDFISDALELGRATLLTSSDAAWIVVIRQCVQHGKRTDNILAKLVVYVPTETDPEKELLRALTSFEQVVSKELGLPVDTAYRRIEGDDLLCVVCGEVPQWRYPASTGFDDYFCDLHVRDDERFFRLGLIPVRQKPVTI